MLRNYYAAYVDTAEAIDESLLNLIDFRLVSYFHMKSGKSDDFFFRKNRHRYTSIMLDSGAFSAWRGKTEISFRDYLKYCKKHAAHINYFVNLDRIPVAKSEAEARRKHAAVMGAVEGGYRNYRQMVSELAEVGVPKDRIIHVYHQFEPIEVLKEMVDHDRMDYVGLSHCTGTSPKAQREFFKTCFEEVIMNEHGQPKCKTHAFGLGRTDLLSEFPFYSADASSWAANACMSGVLVPLFRDVDSRFGDPLELRWDFSKLENFNLGYLLKKKDYYMNKRLASRGATASYRVRLFAYIFDVDREYPFPIVDGHELTVGESVIHQKNNRETLGPNETEISLKLKALDKFEELHGNLAPSTMLTEERLKYGLIHNPQWRMKVNIVGMNYFVRQLDPEGYEAFQRSKAEHAFAIQPSPELFMPAASV